jgi:predicted aspartyl protease
MFKVCRFICAILVLVVTAAIDSSAAETEHSAHLEVSHGKPFVMVMVNGKGPFRFVIDTGTGGDAFVSSELAFQLGLPQSGQMRLSDPSGKGSRRVPLVILQSLQVAGVEFTGVKAAVHNLSNDEGLCQGLLGFTLFRQYLLTLDYPNHRMMLTTGELTRDGERSVLPFRMPDGIPLVPLDVGGTTIEAQLDSGGAGLSLPEGLATRLKFSSDPASFSNAHSLSTRFQLKAGQLAADVHFGAYTFQHPFVEINPAFPLANFGACPLQIFIVTFDQKNTLVRFESSRRILHLAPTPEPMRLESTAPDRPPDNSLVPVG